MADLIKINTAIIMYLPIQIMYQPQSFMIRLRLFTETKYYSQTERCFASKNKSGSILLNLLDKAFSKVFE